MNIIELNEYGLAIWQHHNIPMLFAERAYKWVDRILFIEEREGNRRYLNEMDFSEWDPIGWRAVTKEEFDRMKARCSDVS